MGKRMKLNATSKRYHLRRIKSINIRFGHHKTEIKIKNSAAQSVREIVLASEE